MARGFSTSLEVDGLEDAIRVVRRVENLGEDPTPLLYIAASILEASVTLRFNQEKGPEGVPWPKSKRALGLVRGAAGKKRVGKTLHDTGELQNSLKSEVRPNEVEVGFTGLENAQKAIANQYGATLRVRHYRVVNSRFGVPLPEPKLEGVRGHLLNLPARPMLGFDTEDRKELVGAFTDRIKGLLHG